jgi:hypothetical protein
MMAGAAIFGIIVAVLRLPDVGAPIRAISVGVNYELVDGQLKSAGEAGYYEHYGMLISFIGILGLAFACYLLAAWGAKGTIREEDEMEAAGGGAPEA